MGRNRIAYFVCAGAAVFACGPKFTSDEQSGGASGSAGSAVVAGSSTGATATDGGAGFAGDPSSGGVASAGNGGTTGGGNTVGGGGVPPIAGGGAHTGGAIGVSGASMGGVGGGVTMPPPIPVNGLELWFRADQGVTQSGGAVSTWKDVSGKHRDAFQTALNYRPKLVDNAIAGKPALMFDGVDDYLKLPTLSADFGNGISIFVTLHQKAVTTCEGFFEASNGSEIDDIHLGDWRQSLLMEVKDDYVNDTNYPIVVDAPQIAVGILDSTQTAHLRSNSNGVGEGPIAFPTKIDRNDVFIGKTMYQGCSVYTGAIGEVLVYSRAVSDPELVQIEAYLQAKWGCCTQ